MPRQQLENEIIKLSNADSWADACAEWNLSYIYFAPTDDPETCLCGKHPIFELCVIENRHNSNEATVGNVCVNEFLGFGSDKIFQATKRIKSDDECALNVEAIEYGYEQGWLSDWECEFYTDTWRKRNLSEKQLGHRVRINRKFLARIEAAQRRKGRDRPAPPKLRPR